MSQWRGAIVVLVICLLFGSVMWRAVELQIGRAADLSREARSQLAGSLEIRARRGAIYDRNGEEMAVSVMAESIFARPREIASPGETATALSGLLGSSEAAILQEITSPHRFRWLARRVAPHVASQIRQLALPGIDSMTEWQRFYPMRFRAGHLLGFVGDDGYGLEGVERSSESLLSGGIMEVQGLRDVQGRPIISFESPDLEALEGASIVLTIDATLQRIAEREIERAVVEQSARTGVVVILDPGTGEVLAMTNWPLFDPNRFRSYRPADWRNRAVTDAWEPGSTFKIFTYAAALEAGVIEPHSPIDCSGGRLRIGRYRIRDTHRGHETLLAWQVIQFSSNVGIYRIGQRLGEEALYQAYRDFGFGEPTDIGLGGEQSGQLASPPWAEIELANRSFGQGVTTTPIQMALAYSAIANGGELMAPQLVREIRNMEGEVLETRQVQVRRRVLSEQTTRRATEALMSAVESAGTGWRAAIEGIAVAGKTGTAQKVDPETGTYADLWMSSFIGFVPADDPQFTIVVMIDEPQEEHYGGLSAAPVFARIAEQALATRGIFAARTPSEESDISALSRQENPNPSEPADREVQEERQGVDQDAALLVPNRLPERRERVRVPEFAGLNLSEALLAAQSCGLDIEVHGWGIVRHQWPAPGARIRPGSIVDLYLRAQYELTREPLMTRNR